ncbi:NADP-dependent oxidoreductase domain-containing protein [Clohesyomyces aquaticus]|uniref:NADP-dependent oxidoreductase domain-containing protein n=1 Tax=Clohesyomyces aquaticus TaxID=1231657 RepID=A0A1Y2A186_9PLEO|nr:NADP-dependent oxidoreductase domain-containing protein [Clohesyomyces aquaticus]
MPLIMGREVGPIGYGLLGLTNHFAPIPREQAFAAMRAALDAGCNLWDGGEFYGTPENNSLTLLRDYYEKYPEDAEKVVLNIKGALEPYPSMKPTCSRAGIRASVERCLAQLGPRGKIDMFEPARKDPTVPFSETLLALKELQDEGKIGGIALSEVNADSIREASALVPLVAIEIELSLFTRTPLSNSILSTAASLSLPILAYSPLSRGLLSTSLTAPPTDMRRILPRFQSDNFAHNRRIVEAVDSIAKRKGVTLAQLSLAWCVETGRRGGGVVVPIPGSGRVERVRENAGAGVVGLSGEGMREIEEVLGEWEVKGERYHERGMEMVDM